MQSKDIMQTELITVRAGMTLREAAELMAKHNVSGLPVLNEENTLMGMISESDIMEGKGLFTRLDHWIQLESFLHTGRKAGNGFVEEFSSELDNKVEEVMSERTITVTPETPLREVVDLMTANKINRVPVVEGRKLVGIVARNDILRALSKGGPTLK